MADESKDPRPASARPIADANGRTADLHYSPAHLNRLRELKRKGARINLPPGVTLDDAPAGAPSTDASGRGNLLGTDTIAGTAGSDRSGGE